jgi:hypothetical protein
VDGDVVLLDVGLLGVVLASGVVVPRVDGRFGAMIVDGRGAGTVDGSVVGLE